MKTLLVLAISLLSTSAFAGWHHGNPATRPVKKEIYSQSMSCADTAAAVSKYRAVLLRYGTDLYERVVSTQRYCDSASGEVTMPFWAPTADDASCFVGYTCENNYGGGY